MWSHPMIDLLLPTARRTLGQCCQLLPLRVGRVETVIFFVATNDYLKTTVFNMAPRHWTMLEVIRTSTCSSRWRFGSCLPTFLIANWQGEGGKRRGKGDDGQKYKRN